MTTFQCLAALKIGKRFCCLLSCILKHLKQVLVCSCDQATKINFWLEKIQNKALSLYNFENVFKMETGLNLTSHGKFHCSSAWYLQVVLNLQLTALTTTWNYNGPEQVLYSPVPPIAVSQGSMIMICEEWENGFALNDWFA